MWKNLLVFLLPKIWKEAEKNIEKQDLVTKALEICYKNPNLKLMWTTFVDGVISWLLDAADEAKRARNWK